MPSTEWLRTRIISRCASRFLDWVKALKITLVANAHQLVSTVTSFGASPIIRIPWNEEWMIKRALDAGAQGVMTPMCHSAVSLQFLAQRLLRFWHFSHPFLSSQEDAKRIVSYSKYPPTGTRGYGPMFCPPVFGCKGSDYDAGADKNLLVIVQIESRKGVENVEEIAKVEGLDCLFIGT